MSPASRIAIDPEEVRGLATRMRGGALIFSNSGRALAQRSLPAMPVSLAGHVNEAIGDANAELQDLAVELIEDAAHLEARVTWAELGGGPETAWLVPGLHRYASRPPVPASPVAETPSVTEEQIRAEQSWALEMLDGMHDRALDGEIDRLGPRADDLVDVIDTYADEVPVKPLGDFTLAAEAGSPGELRLEATGAAGFGARSGVLGTGFSILFSSPTGWGVAGCLLAGGLIASSGDLLEDH